MARLIAGVKQSAMHNRDAAQRFTTHAQTLSTQLATIAHECNCSVEFSALFYRADSGLFLAYDAEMDELLPLG